MPCEGKWLNHVWLFATSWNKAHQTPLSMAFSRQGILEWVAILFSRRSSWSRDQTRVSCIAGRFFAIWATKEAPLNAISTIFNDWYIVFHLDSNSQLNQRLISQPSVCVPGTVPCVPSWSASHFSPAFSVNSAGWLDYRLSVTSETQLLAIALLVVPPSRGTQIQNLLKSHLLQDLRDPHWTTAALLCRPHPGLFSFFFIFITCDVHSGPSHL